MTFTSWLVRPARKSIVQRGTQDHMSRRSIRYFQTRHRQLSATNVENCWQHLPKLESMSSSLITWQPIVSVCTVIQNSSRLRSSNNYSFGIPEMRREQHLLQPNMRFRAKLRQYELSVEEEEGDLMNLTTRDWCVDRTRSTGGTL